MGKTVTISMDDLPPITEAERRRFREMEQAGEPIDFSDIPPLSPEALRQAERGRFFRPTKQQITLRIDANVLDWFRRNTSKGYQTDINRVLSDYVARQRKKTG
jgi:uncharacterized protein (DUF4415 family)